MAVGVNRASVGHSCALVPVVQTVVGIDAGYAATDRRLTFAPNTDVITLALFVGAASASALRHCASRRRWTNIATSAHICAVGLRIGAFRFALATGDWAALRNLG